MPEYHEHDQTTGAPSYDTTPQPSGGSVTGALRRVGPFAFSFDTPGIETGIPVGWTPDVDDWLEEVQIEVTEAFDAVSSAWDVGAFTGGSTTGLFARVNSGSVMNLPPSPAVDVAAGGWSVAEGVAYQSGVAASATNGSYRFAARATAGVPLKFVLSNDGTTEGSPIGGTSGAGNLYLIVSTPAPF